MNVEEYMGEGVKSTSDGDEGVVECLDEILAARGLS